MSASTQIDTSLLRKGLRLVHCLQKERGASCAYHAGSTEISSLKAVYRDTDRAITPRFRNALKKLRELGLHNVEDRELQRLLVCYNSLIQHVVHEYILRFTARHCKTPPRTRSRSIDRERPKICGHRRGKSMGDEDQMELINAFREVEKQEQQQAEVSYEEEGDSSLHISRLVHLLDVFVRLKEATGVERATLCSIAAAGESAKLLLNNLVTEVENQRRNLQEMNNLPEGPLRDLTHELVVSLSPQMNELQDDILGGLDSQSLKEKYDSSHLWDLLSLYINKLHSLELLLVEEIECCDAQVDIQVTDNFAAEGSTNDEGSRSGTNDLMVKAFGESKESDLAQMLVSMDPTLIKDMLLAALHQPTEVNDINGTATPQIPLLPTASSPALEEIVNELTRAPASKEWEIDLYEVSFIRRIGEGAAGTTYLAKWSGLEVAVKVASITEMGLDGWRKEVQALQKLHHPNIIRLLGSVYHPNPLTFCLVLEYCNAGDLSVALQHPTPPNFFFHVATSIAKGMSYLHNRGVIHRDIKPANVLLDGKISTGIFSVKVTDFGVATESKGRNDDKTAETGTYRWMPPEVIRHEAYSQTADVFSYGVVLWQLLTRENPFADKSQVEAAAAVALEDRRPPSPAGIPTSVLDLINNCWTKEPDERPAFPSIIERLGSIETSLSPDEKEWMETANGHHVYSETFEERKQRLLDQRKAQEAKNNKLKETEDKGKRRVFKRMFKNRKSSYF